MKRTMLAIATVMLVITPISWILLHEPRSDKADASIPYITRDDDTYITSSNEPVVSTSPPPTSPPPTKPTPGATPTKPSRTPSSAPTPGRHPTTTPSSNDPTTVPTTGPTTGPSDGPGNEPTHPTDEPTRTAQSHGPSPTAVPSKPLSSQPLADDGSMSGDEQQLFRLIDDARAQKGCAPLTRNSDLTGGARNDADSRADSNDSSSDGSKAAAVGEDLSVQAAFDKLKNENSGTLLNCGLHELGVGRGAETYRTCALFVICSDHTRIAWVVDFQ